MAALFPPPPAGYLPPEPPALRDGPSPCQGEAAGAGAIQLSVKYERAERVRTAGTPEYAGIKEILAKIDALEKLPPEAKARFDAIDAVRREKSKARGAAARAKETAEADRLKKEMDAAYEEGRKIKEDHSAAMRPQVQALRAEEKKIRELIDAKYLSTMRIYIHVNDRFSQLDGNQGWSFGAAAPPSLKVRTVLYKFDGPASEAERFMAGVDQARLKALVGLQ